MSRNAKVAAIASTMLGAAFLLFWPARTTSLTYTVPSELVGAAVSLDGRPIGVASPQLELTVSKARHTIRLEKPGRPPVVIEVDLSGQTASGRLPT